MAFEQRYDVSSQEFGHNNIIRPSAIWRYMQESASRQMLAEGPSYGELFENGLAFVLSRMNVVFHKDIRPCEKITCKTWACDERGASFCRSYQLIKENGEVAVEAYAIWALLNFKTHKLCLVEEADLHYSNGQGLELPLPKKFRLPKDLEYSTVGVKKVMYSDIDCNGHMNNTFYPDMLCNYIDDIDSSKINSISIYYANEAPLGSEIELSKAFNDGAHYFRTTVNGAVNIEAIINTSPLKKEEK